MYVSLSEKLTCFLCAQGYKSCPTDPCVMRKVINGSVFLLLIYVDDILVLTDKEEAERLQQAFVQEFQWITIDYGSIHSYLGMQIVLKDGYTMIDMTHLVDKLLLTCQEPLVEYACPATKTLFQVDEKAEKLSETERKKFHTTTAKLLYLTKRARQDILTPVVFKTNEEASLIFESGTRTQSRHLHRRCVCFALRCQVTN